MTLILNEIHVLKGLEKTFIVAAAFPVFTYDLEGRLRFTEHLASV